MYRKLDDCYNEFHSYLIDILINVWPSALFLVDFYNLVMFKTIEKISIIFFYISKIFSFFTYKCETFKIIYYKLC